MIRGKIAEGEPEVVFIFTKEIRFKFRLNENVLKDFSSRKK
jgi:hypothetical protein